MPKATIEVDFKNPKDFSLPTVFRFDLPAVAKYKGMVAGGGLEYEILVAGVLFKKLVIDRNGSTQIWEVTDP